MLIKRKKLPITSNKFKEIDNRNEQIISDVYDGSLYKQFRSSVNFSPCTYSFTLNTDGVKLCDKSNLTLWPVYLIINELDSEERFYIYNTIIVGKF